MASTNTQSPSYTYSLAQCDEESLASLYSILRAEKPLRPDDCVWIEDTASALSRDIALAEEHIARLQAHCNASRKYLSIYRSAFAPIRSLPRDVLVSIFEHTFQEKYICMDVGKPPWTVGQVCRSWRDTVLSCHSLWATVNYFSEHGTHDSVTEIMQEYLRRSGQHPLSVMLEGTCHAPVCDLIFGEYHRWRLLYVMVVDSSFASRLSSLPGSLQQLEELYIMEGDCDVFLRASQLKCVWTDARLSLPSADNITHYSAQLTVSELNTLTESLYPSLINCEIELSHDSLSEMISPSLPIHHSRLKRFEICGDALVLNWFVLPALTTLGIITSDREDPAVVGSAISSFIQRSSCTLTTLILGHHRFLECLRLQCLESLVCVSIHLQDLESFCRAISSPKVAFTNILPDLSTFVIVLATHTDRYQVPSWDAFIGLIEERHTTRRLKTFRILYRYGFNWLEKSLTALRRHPTLHTDLVSDDPSDKDFKSMFWKTYV